MSQLISSKRHVVKLRGYLLSIVGSAIFFFGATPVCNGQEVEAISDAPLVQVRPKAHQIGEVTSALLTMQANGSAAGPALPMLGATSTLSWERYKDSFKYKIPESFDRAVKKSGG